MMRSLGQDDLKELFKVPNSYPSGGNSKTQLVAAFIDFLSQIFYDYNNPKQGIYFLYVIYKLESLVPIFGFTALQATGEQHQAHTLLAQFENLANQAGTLLYSRYYSPDPQIESLDAAVATLFQDIHSFKGHIIDFLDSIPYAFVNPRAHFLIPRYLGYFLGHSHPGALTELLHELQNYHSQSLVNFMDKEMKEDVMRVSDAAYEVKSLLKHSLAGEVPRWFLTMRRTHLNDEIKNVGITKHSSVRDSASLAELLDQIIGRISYGEIMNRLPFLMAWSRLRVAREYALSLGNNSNFSLQMHQNWSLNEVWQGRFEPPNHQTIYAMLVGFLRDDLKELLKVPNSNDPKTLNKSELVSTFITFLLQILHQCKDDSAFINTFQAVNEELRYLVVILGDTPFQATEHPKLETLLAEFEDVANEAGSALHSAFFHPDLVLEQMDGVIAALSEHTGRLKHNIMEFLNSLPNTVAILGANSFFIVDSLANDLEGLLKQDGNLPSDVKGQIGILHEKLKPYLSKNGGVEEVVIQIREVAHEVEYLINNFLVGDAPHWYLTTRLTHLIDRIQNVGIDHQKLKKDFDVGVVEVSEVSSAQSSQEVPSNTIRSDIYMPVFENQKKEILDQLLMGTEELERIFIVGMGGVGKTTLAKQLYNDHAVGCHFDRRLWCTVSQMPDWKNIFISILTGLEKNAFSTMAEETLILKVYQGLKSRRFLIVIDDIWRSDDLEYLQRWFPNDQNGSRMLLTSRNGDVAPSCSVICKLDPWTEDQCLELIYKKACLNDKPHPRGLEERGKKMATKCFGLPLAADVMAGMLFTEGIEDISLEITIDSVDYYEQFGESTSIMKVLELSYKSLPPYLKPCFLYCGIFREDEKIHTKKLKQLWIAQGFIPTEENERMETTAEQYMKVLIDRNLLTVTKKRLNDEAKFCVIHDLLRELCLMIAEKENFLTWMQSNHSMYNQKHHHLCVSDPMAVGTSLEPFGRCFRSLFVLDCCESPLDLCNVKLLRALQLHEFCHYCLIGIELLFHLRYLAIDRVRISIHTIAKNLEFLIVQEGFDITPEILKMLKLRFIHGYGGVTFDEGCETVLSSNLEFLSDLFIRDKKDEEILGNLLQLRRLKCSYGTRDAAIDFHCLTQCESLSLRAIDRWCCNIDVKLPTSIKKLNLDGFGFPWETMSVIGALPNLEVLKLNSAFDGKIWKTGDNEFKRLRYLKMEALDLTEWIIDSSRPFPRLQQLILKHCHNLKEIPIEIGEVDSLCVIKVEGECKSSLGKSALKIQQEQQDFNDQLKVIVSVSDDEEHTESDEEHTGVHRWMMKNMKSIQKMMEMTLEIGFQGTLYWRDDY